MNQLLSTLWTWIASLFSTKRKAATTAGAAAVLAATAAFVGSWEGERTEAYLDRAASPPVWTVCYGETRGVKQGDRYTSAECSKMLMTALASFREGLTKCIPALPQQPQGVQVALVSWSYNVGTGAACSSTLAKRADGVMPATSCHAGTRPAEKSCRAS